LIEIKLMRHWGGNHTLYPPGVALFERGWSSAKQECDYSNPVFDEHVAVALHGDG
tara:strand:+ start:283 stop:447 length:165 start_codon:yes stop_codon:yes gene_type:complete